MTKHLPLRRAYDLIDEKRDPDTAAALLIDICNQSTNEDRL